MEYVFGTNADAEVLRVKGPEHTELSGFQQVVREYPDQTITDRFRVVRKLKSEEDPEGNCYDWYEIDRHYRTQDKSVGFRAALDTASKKLEAAIQSNAMLEDCLVEMAEAVYG